MLIIARCTSKNVEKFFNGDGNGNGVVTDVKEDVGMLPQGPSPRGPSPKAPSPRGPHPHRHLVRSVDIIPDPSYWLRLITKVMDLMVPPSMQQDYTTNLSFGKASIQPPKSFVFFSDQHLQGAPINASMDAFDPSAKGGLPSLIGQKQQGPPDQGQAVSDGLFSSGQGQPSAQGKPSGSGSGSSKSVKVYMVYGDWCGWSKKALGPFKEAMNESGVTTSNGDPSRIHIDRR